MGTKTNPKAPYQTSQRTGITIIVSLLALVIVIIVMGLLSGISDVRSKRSLAVNGASAMGRVTHLEELFHSSRGGGWDSYSVDYTFSYIDQANVQHEIASHNKEVPQSVYSKLHVGSDIEVSYLPDKAASNKPTVSLRIFDDASRRLILLCCVFPSLLLMLGINKKYLRLNKRKGATPLLFGVLLIVLAVAFGSVVGNLMLVRPLQTLLFNV